MDNISYNIGREMARQSTEKQAFIAWGGSELGLHPKGKGVGAQVGYTNLLGTIPIPLAGIDIGGPKKGFQMGASPDPGSDLGVSPYLGIRWNHPRMSGLRRVFPRGIPEVIYDKLKGRTKEEAIRLSYPELFEDEKPAPEAKKKGVKHKKKDTDAEKDNDKEKDRGMSSIKVAGLLDMFRGKPKEEASEWLVDNPYYESRKIAPPENPRPGKSPSRLNKKERELQGRWDNFDDNHWDLDRDMSRGRPIVSDEKTLRDYLSRWHAGMQYKRDLAGTEIGRNRDFDVSDYTEDLEEDIPFNGDDQFSRIEVIENMLAPGKYRVGKEDTIAELMRTLNARGGQAVKSSSFSNHIGRLISRS